MAYLIKYKKVTTGRFKGMLRRDAVRIYSKEYYVKDKGAAQKRYDNSPKGKTTKNIRLYRKKVEREKYPHKTWKTPKAKDMKEIYKEIYKKTIEKAKASPGGLAAWKKIHKKRQAKWYSETRPLRLVKHRKYYALHKSPKKQHIKDWKKQKTPIKAHREQSWWTDDVQVSGIYV